MTRPTRRQDRRSLELRVPSVEFLGEQDGEPERLLKERLIECFERDSRVRRAYLARVHAAGQFGVALCMKTIGNTDRRLIDKVHSIFARIFDVRQHLDILFLTESDELLLARVCLPFFSDAPGHNASSRK